MICKTENIYYLCFMEKEYQLLLQGGGLPVRGGSPRWASDGRSDTARGHRRALRPGQGQAGQRVMRHAHCCLSLEFSLDLPLLYFVKFSSQGWGACVGSMT